MIITVEIICLDFEDNQPAFIFSLNHRKFLNFPQDIKEIKVNYGIHQVNVKLESFPELMPSNNSLVINQVAAKKLSLRTGQRLQIKVCGKAELDIGPLIGCFISSKKITRLKSEDYDSIYLSLLNHARILGGEVFLFSIDDIDWGHQLVNGYLYNPDLPKKLVEAQFPLPRVIYNRCFGSKKEVSRLVSKMRSAPGITITNSENIRLHESKTKLSGNFAPAKILGCSIEARTLIQKDFSGEWQYTGGTIRLIPKESSTTYDFDRYPLDDGLKKLFPTGYKAAKLSLINKAVSEALKHEKILPTALEFEIDLGLTHVGKTWVKKVIEKPLKNFITNFRGSYPSHLSISRPLHYCFRLAGFPLHQEAIPLSITEQKEHGPIIGIFEALNTIDSIKSQNTDSNQLALVKATKELGCSTYHFSIYDIIENDYIMGWYYDHSEHKWLSKPFPWPHVLYDRATFKHTSQRQVAKKFRKDLKWSGKTMFLNTRSVFGKGFTSEILKQMPLLKNHLPFNIVNPSSKKIYRLLQHYKIIFIKTEYGSDNKGVIKITQQKNGYLMSTKYEKKSFQNFSKLWSEILSFIGSESFVAQEGITALPYRGKPLEIRSIIQKNGMGTWENTLIKPWIATDASSRGYPLPWTETISNIFSSYTQTAIIQAKISYLSLAVAKTLEAYNGPLGELGIDFILDYSGHPWVIEVNGKTNKTFFIKDEKMKSRYNLFFNPIAYSCFLTRQHTP